MQQQAQGGDAPFAPGVTVADIVTGMTCFSAIVAALYDREHTGRGQRIDTTLMDCQLAMLSEVAVPALNGATEADWKPFRHPIHATSDGRHVTINIGGARNFARIAAALGHAGEAMPANPEAANAVVGGWVAALPAATVAREMERAGAPYGLVQTMPEAAAHPYFAERGMVAEIAAGPGEGGPAMRVVRSPLFFWRQGAGRSRRRRSPGSRRARCSPTSATRSRASRR